MQSLSQNSPHKKVELSESNLPIHVRMGILGLVSSIINGNDHHLFRRVRFGNTEGVIELKEGGYFFIFPKELFPLSIGGSKYARFFFRWLSENATVVGTVKLEKNDKTYDGKILSISGHSLEAIKKYVRQQVREHIDS